MPYNSVSSILSINVFSKSTILHTLVNRRGRSVWRNFIIRFGEDYTSQAPDVINFICIPYRKKPKVSSTTIWISSRPVILSCVFQCSVLANLSLILKDVIISKMNSQNVIVEFQAKTQVDMSGLEDIKAAVNGIQQEDACIFFPIQYKLITSYYKKQEQRQRGIIRPQISIKKDI